MIMKIDIKQIKDNPFRDFELYPIDEEQVQRLAQSIGELGFFSGVTARPAGGGMYELAAGHHRVKAAGKANINIIEAVVEKYTDHQMVEIMAAENLLQRGHNAASTLDSVAAFSKIIAKEVLLGEGDSSKILEETGHGMLAKAQTNVAKDGPGMLLIYRAMNGFSKEDRKANKQAEKISSTDIDEALSGLKSGGKMGTFMAEVYAKVEAIRAEREAEAEAERKRIMVAEWEADQRRQEELGRKNEAAIKAAAESEKRLREAEEAKAKNAADAKAKARMAEIAKKEFLQRDKEAEAQAAKNNAEREAAKKAKAQRDAKAKVEADRQAKERAAIKAQKELEAVYDIACVNIFRLTSHEKAFRNGMLSVNGKRFIPRKSQLALAKEIRAEIDAIEKKRGMDLGSVTIDGMIDNKLASIVREQKGIDERERQALLDQNAYDKVNDYWVTLRRGLQQAESALANIIEAQKNWKQDRLFPMDVDAVERISLIGQQFITMRKKLGL